MTERKRKPAAGGGEGADENHPCHTGIAGAAESGEHSRLKEVFDKTSDIVAIAHPDERLMDINDAGRRALGWDPGESLEDKSIADCHPPSALDLILREGIPTALEEGSWEGETALLRADGQRIPVSQVIMAHRAEDGRLLYLSTIMRDISARKQAERALAASEQRYRSILQQLSDVVFISDLDGQLTYATPSCVRMLGYAPEQLIGRNAFELVHPDDLDAARREFGVSAAGASDGVPTELRVRHADGHWVPLEVLGNSMIDRPGVGGIVLSCRDISERKRTEEALRESEERFRSIVESSPMGIYQYELRGRDLVLIGANPAADRITGVDGERRFGLTIEEAFPNLAQTDVPDRYREVTRTGVPWQTSQLLYEDQDISGAFDITAFRTSPGRMAVMFTEVTDRIRAEQALRRSERLFRAQFHGSPIGMAITSPEKRWVEVNDTLCRMLGYTRRELQRVTWADLTHPEDLQEDLRRFERVLAGDIDSYALEKRFVRKDDTVLRARLHVSCLRRPDGEVENLIAHVQEVGQGSAGSAANPGGERPRKP